MANFHCKYRGLCYFIGIGIGFTDRVRSVVLLAEGNGLLLTPTVDHLFDRGFIRFEECGELIVSPVVDQISLKRMGINLRSHLGLFPSTWIKSFFWRITGRRYSWLQRVDDLQMKKQSLITLLFFIIYGA